MKYFLGFLAVVGLIVLVFVLVLGGLGGGKKGAPNKPSEVILSDYTNTATIMRLTVDGPVNADQLHKAVRITVGRDQNVIELITGYQGTVAKKQSYNTNTQAYETFLRSLQKLNFTKGDSTPALADERGFCPSGERYIYEIMSGVDTVERYWGSTCGQGTFKGIGPSVRALFRAQIPDYNLFVNGTGL